MYVLSIGNISPTPACGRKPVLIQYRKRRNKPTYCITLMLTIEIMFVVAYNAPSASQLVGICIYFGRQRTHPLQAPGKYRTDQKWHRDEDKPLSTETQQEKQIAKKHTCGSSVCHKCVFSHITNGPQRICAGRPGNSPSERLWHLCRLLCLRPLDQRRGNIPRIL